MSRSRRNPWSLVLWISLALVGMTLAILAYAGTGEVGVRTVIRATARTSLALFLLAFTASSLRRLFPVPATAALLRQRRYLGVSFAVSHGLHLMAIAVVYWNWRHPFLEQSATPAAIYGGGLAYVLIAAMTITSFDRTARWLGPRRWKILHTVGSYLVFIIFAQSYIPRARKDLAYLPLAIALLVALLLRVAARLRKRGASPAAA